MSTNEAEEMLGITEEDKIDCPHGDCEDCPLGLDAQSCQDLYDDWLIEQIENMDE